ncbi:hypothetical protein SODALDRAFT_320710 [Sodiomyces alkalinus F11]|uniref:DNA damage-responsive protein 48 n=1 Tax=Sodiomyces alkalinus (strain CBS 110278 / VKM F-3762 / F11) TaxID=1314773 RepID=A0A3N2PLX3_SODAK|nr:hypothetical protein SODALDRAFT_320710 [Sodiomyces alkalinus F11]ROT35356.1 hypothetical protein SODALDRAFT_320710 [Sodiomyces alkalinus F11]
MDFINKMTADKSGAQKPQMSTQENTSSAVSGGSGQGLMDKVNSMTGGGPQSEKNEDYLDKGVDFVQEHVLGQDQQSNETAAEQAKDEVISDTIRSKYKGATGSEFPVPDKDRKYGSS